MNVQSAAVFAIDFQNEYRSCGAYPVEGFDAILANAASVIAAARQAGVPVLHAQAWAEQEDVKTSYPLLHENLADDLRYGVAGADSAAICEEVMPAGDELVIRKSWPSAFRDRRLAETLRERGVEHLLVAGVWTDSCVRATVFDAVFAGFRVWLIKDACGSGTDFMNRVAILDMANRLYGGGVLKTAEALKALRGEPHQAWRCSRPVEFQYTAATADTFYESL
ncbi:MAG: isochorismatase family cysteine hydrolase [Mesorhizobium sp.]